MIDTFCHHTKIVCLSLDLSKNRLRDENGKCTLGCGLGMGLLLGLIGGVKEGKGGDAKICFSAGCAAQVHHFQDIRQGALRAHAERECCYLM